MKILYRISEGGNRKHKLPYVHDKRKMFVHFINIFKECDIYVFANNVSVHIQKFLIRHYRPSKIFRTALGNAKSFMHSVDFALERFDNNENLYFAEDDYVYRSSAPRIIEEGLTIANYSSGYDHPDKYINHSQGGPNPFIEKGGELTRVLMTNSCHWKLTNSCCMTFASTVNIMKQDYEVFKNSCTGKDPGDFGIFCELIQRRNRTLVSCLPAVSTHGEMQWLSKFVNWDKDFYDSL